MQQLDQTDRRILLALSTAAKRTASAVATTLGLGRNTVQTRITRLENEVLDSLDRRIPAQSLGYGLLSFVELHVEQRHLEDIAAQLEQIPEVLEAHARAAVVLLDVGHVSRAAHHVVEGVRK